MHSSDKKNTPIVIVGAGITGLSCAYFLKKTGRPIYIVEKSEQAGGLLSCFEHNGYKLEKFYHHFFNEDEELKYLIKKLNLSEHFKSHHSSVGIEHKNTIFPFTTAQDMLQFKPLSLINRIRFGVSSLMLGKALNWKKYHSTSAYDWFLKYAGAQVTHTIWEPMMLGKFSKAYKDIPLSWFIGRLKQRMSSRKKSGSEQLYYIQGSLEKFISALVLDLKKDGIHFLFEDSIENIDTQNNVISNISTQKGYSFSSPYLILTTPSHVSAKIIEKNDANLASHLKRIEYYHAHCLVLILKKSLSPVYWLNVTDKKSPFVGIIEHTQLVSKEYYNKDHIVYLTKYSLSSDPLANMSKAEIKKTFLDHLQEKFPNYDLNKNLKECFVFHSPTAAPVCTLDFDQKIKSCDSIIQNLQLSMMPHVYPDERSVNNAIRIAHNTCTQAGFKLDSLPQGNNIAAQIF